MSRSTRYRTAALVCEGSSDVPVLSAIIQAIWPEIGHVLTLRPEVDEVGRLRQQGRSGWSEVRAWCRANAELLDAVIDPGIGERLDLLVVALDVDIAVAAGIANPPAKTTAYDTKRLCDVVKSWLGAPNRRLPKELVIAVPAMSIEAWVLSAVYKKPTHPERVASPVKLLVERGKLPILPGGGVLKPLPTYEAFGNRVVANLPAVRQRCAEAKRFCAKIEAVRDEAA